MNVRQPDKHDSTMTDRPHQLKILLSPEEKRWLDQIAAHRGLTASDVVRQYIRLSRTQLVTTESVIDSTVGERPTPPSVVARIEARVAQLEADLDTVRRERDEMLARQNA